jgi:diadenosine tetraphosphate (Ap4A) HIT family hydrolase
MNPRPREHTQPTLTELCQALPFLNELPSELLQKLDTSTFHACGGIVAGTRVELEKELNCHVMTYRAAPPAPSGKGGLHLCRLLVPASLAPAQMELLQRAEAACRDEGVVFVAYDKPLRLRETGEEEREEHAAGRAPKGEKEMNDKPYPTIIHERVALARSGDNPTVICRLASGWVVLGDDQRLKGYCLLLADPIRDNLNELDLADRAQFLTDMTIVGDALMEVLGASIINYSILGNSDRALHVHIHPRYDSEEPEKRRTIPFIYHLSKAPPVPFDPEHDRPLMDHIGEAIRRRTKT